MQGGFANDGSVCLRSDRQGLVEPRPYSGERFAATPTHVNQLCPMRGCEGTSRIDGPCGLMIVSLGNMVNSFGLVADFTSIVLTCANDTSVKECSRRRCCK